MKETMLMFARYSRRADASVMSLLGGLSNEAREENRKSYYGSLSSLALHLLGGMTYFQGLFRASLGDRPEKLAFLEPGTKVSIPKIPLSISQWGQVSADFAAVDDATVAFVESLEEKDLAIPIKLDWYDGRPAAVPLHIMLDQLLVHGIHHRGQISQILDELGVEHDFSGLELDLLPL